MATSYQQNYPVGSYSIRVKSNTLGEENSGTPFLALQVEVVSGKNIKGSVIYGGTRTIKLYLSEKAAPYTKAQLDAAGFTGSIAQLDLDHPDHFSLEGYEADASCKHNEFNGKTYDNFSLYKPKPAFGAKLNKVNTSRMMQLDALFGCNSVQAPKKTESKLFNHSVVDSDPFSDFNEDVPF
jgi:hypothetical protein